jgi:1,5-anhydro-D-fructose reductase (1,5-anhydro-D-mannitol-forming)
VEGGAVTEAGPIRWGFIGASTWASRYLIPAVRAQPDAVGVGVFSSSRERGEEFAASNELEKSYLSIEALLADDQIDAVYISTTNELHAEQAIAAARAGKHVLCEKPLALTLADANRMREACREAGVVFAVDHHLRAAPTIVAMREMIASGAIGELVAGRVFHARWLLEELQTWRLDRPEAGGGVILDITVHDADVVRFLFDDEVTTVMAMSANQGLAGAGLEDSVMGVMRMRAGQLVSFHDAFTVPHAGTGVEVHGSEGSLIGRDLLMPEPVGQVFLRRGDTTEEIVIEERGPIYVEVVRRFDAAVRGEGTPLADGDDGFATLAIAMAALESVQAGRIVAVSDQVSG